MHEGSLSGPNSNELDGICATAYQKAVTLGRFDREEIARTLGTSLEVAVRVEQTLTEFSLLHPMPGEPETLMSGWSRRARTAGSASFLLLTASRTPWAASCRAVRCIRR